MRTINLHLDGKERPKIMQIEFLSELYFVTRQRQAKKSIGWLGLQHFLHFVSRRLFGFYSNFIQRKNCRTKSCDLSTLHLASGNLSIFYFSLSVLAQSAILMAQFSVQGAFLILQMHSLLCRIMWVANAFEMQITKRIKNKRRSLLSASRIAIGLRLAHPMTADDILVLSEHCIEDRSNRVYFPPSGARAEMGVGNLHIVQTLVRRLVRSAPNVGNLNNCSAVCAKLGKWNFSYGFVWFRCQSCWVVFMKTWVVAKQHAMIPICQSTLRHLDAAINQILHGTSQITRKLLLGLLNEQMGVNYAYFRKTLS